jgi:hypothetical protein
MNIERPQLVRQYQREDKPCIVLALTYSGFIKWTKSQDEDIAKLSIYCAGTTFRKLLNKTPKSYGLVVLPQWYRAAKEYKERVYSLLTQLGFEHQELKNHMELLN